MPTRHGPARNPVQACDPGISGPVSGPGSGHAGTVLEMGTMLRVLFGLLREV